MGILNVFKSWFKSKKETTKENNKINDMKQKTVKLEDDKTFHPEILFLINRPYAEYVDFKEI